MVRTYKRKTQQSWSGESMRQAIAAISGGETSYEAAYREFNIPRGTLHRRVKNEKSEKGLGRFKPVFTPEHEETLKKHILNLEKRLFGLTFADFQTLAFQYAEKNGIIHPFNKEVGMAGRDWVYGYLKRHPTLSFRQPENKSFARSQTLLLSLNFWANLLISITSQPVVSLIPTKLALPQCLINRRKSFL